MRTISLNDLLNARLHPSFNATPQHHRFLDCEQFLSGHIVFYEVESLPRGRYVTISYPWYDLRGPPDDPMFTVQHDDSTQAWGHPISIGILSFACKIARRVHDVNLLWLDRLCICQGDKLDKS